MTQRETTDPAQQSAFENDGVVVLRGFLAPERLEALRGVVDQEIEKQLPKHFSYQRSGSGRFTGSQDLWRQSDAARDFCLNSELPQIVASFLKSETLNMFFDHLFVKEPGSGFITSWHTDTPYWPITGTKIASAWVALDDATIETGALTFLHGSHKWSTSFQPSTFAEDANTPNSQEELLEYLSSLSLKVDESKFSTYEVNEGDVLLFDARILHKAGPNRSMSRTRRGYVIRYTGDDISYQPRPGVHKMMLEPGLAVGASITSARFPLVWPNANAHQATEAGR